ncbi:hypothetical protein EB821_01060 [Candidatus Marinimicrobia bacterium PRS2]|nr:hypothetical protein EB821_01060 [Candidatus Marinimicrobia bacterium PRS2]
MNPRDFCKKREYTTVIGTTYSFDPLFFERIILPDLKFGNSGEVLIIGDGDQLIQSIMRCRSQLRKVGNAFIAEPVYMKGAFHPKILLKIGREGARLLLGSGNMTAGGWGVNNELFSEWILDKDSPHSSLVVNHIIHSLRPYTTSQLSIHTLNRALEYNWLVKDIDEKLDENLIITQPDQPLGKQLVDRWDGKRFHTLKVFTGSTDKNGAFIEWCHQQFGIKKCIIAANEENLSFDISKIKKLPVDISFALLEDNQMMHAKTYIFEGNDGISLIAGSANCSRRAWLMSPIDGGNVEAIIVYDSVESDQLSDLLSKFPETVTNIDEIKVYSDDTKSSDPTDINPYTVINLSLDRFKSELLLEFTNTLPKEYSVEMTIENSDHVLKPFNKNHAVWNVHLDTLPPTIDTLFAEIRIKDANDTISTFEHWINDIDRIRAASSSNRIINAFRTYLDSATDSEYNKALKDLKFIGSVVLDDPSSFQDPYYLSKNSSNDDKEVNEESTEPIEIDSLYKSMSEVNTSLDGNKLDGGHLNAALSLSGIMKLFFSFQDEIQDSEHVTDEENINEQIESAEEIETPIVPEEKPPKKKEVDAKFQKKLKIQIENYFTRLRSSEFREHCTVSQLVQAAAYPLAVTVFGLRNGWIKNELAEKWVVNTIDILFTMIIDEYSGTLDFVKNRYDNENHANIFNQVCGDGTLWIVLLTAIERVNWGGKNSFINKAYAISSMLKYKLLLASTDLGRMSILVKKHKFKQTADWISTKPLEICNALDAIEERLIKKFEYYIKKQFSHEHLFDDIIYGKISWGIVLEEKVAMSSSETTMNVYLHKRGTEKKVKSQGYFVNLRVARENDKVIAKLISNLERL